MSGKGAFRIQIKTKLFNTTYKQYLEDVTVVLGVPYDVGGSGLGGKYEITWSNVDIERLFVEYERLQHYRSMLNSSGNATVLSEHVIVKSGFREHIADMDKAYDIYMDTLEVCTRVSDGVRYGLTNDDILKKNAPYFSRLEDSVRGHAAEAIVAENVSSEIGKKYIKEVKRKLGMK